MRVIKYLMLVFCLLCLVGCDLKKDDKSSWIVGSGVPSGSESEGRLYLDSSTFDLYQYSSSTWTLIGNISGKDGENAVSPSISVNEDGYLMINGEVTGNKLIGEKGEKGEQGEKGNKGQDGINGQDGDNNLYIDEDGHIIIGDIKTSISEYQNGCVLTSDNDSNGYVSILDIVKCGSEEFFVAYNDGNIVKLLAKYNLDVGYSYNSITDELTLIENPSGLQSSKTVGYSEDLDIYHGVVPFSKHLYWSINGSVNPSYIKSEMLSPYVFDNNSLISAYLVEYKKKLMGMKADVIEVRLLAPEEGYAFMCKNEDDTCMNGYASEVFTSSFWTGGIYLGKYESIIAITSTGSIEFVPYYVESDFGIRPLVVVNYDSIIEK